MNSTMLGFVLSLFAAILLLATGIYQWWRGRHSQTARRLSQRVQAAMLNSAGHGRDSGILKQRVLSESPELARLLRQLPHSATFDRMLLQSGLDWSIGRLALLTVALPVIAACMGALLGLPQLALLMLIAGFAALPLLHVRRCRAKRLRKLEQQLPEAADLISRALRAGHSLSSALSMAGDELPAPIGIELGMVFREINYGVPMSDALAGLTDRVPIEDLRYLVIAVLIQRESGGNLAEILDNVGTIIRKRLQLLDKVRVLSAEGRLGAWILTLLPPAVCGLLYVINPGLTATLWTDPNGIRLLWASAAMTMFGVIWMRQIIRIHI
ncbi:type II secretion system F family protein [Cupriavidus basilensis]|uniref:type II secretion system F family protein n=1 Tax=Cupriavidus basilensis TaxID=68895 RepID=UPI0020A659AD|nr:type II secretion system F family protein [Cupriavidus basilensis]MCP3023401.1 type II secretion system F family protein [Cupriavidus basilensis]